MAGIDLHEAHKASGAGEDVRATPRWPQPGSKAEWDSLSPAEQAAMRGLMADGELLGFMDRFSDMMEQNAPRWAERAAFVEGSLAEYWRGRKAD